MIPKSIELEILQELENLEQTKTVSIFHDEHSEWGYMNSGTATLHAIHSKIPQKEIKGLKCFKITDLKELFSGSMITIVVFCDYSDKK